MPYRLGTGQGPATLAPDYERRQPNPPPRDTITQAPLPNGLPVRYRAVPVSARAQEVAFGKYAAPAASPGRPPNAAWSLPLRRGQPEPHHSTTTER
jgi:hypothetical protein